MSTCPNCNKQFDDGVKFCDACGTAIPEAAPAAAPEAPVAAPEAPVAPVVAPAAPVEEKNEGVKLPFELDKKLPFELNKKLLAIGAAALAAIVVLAIIISSVFTAAPSFVLYSKDSDIVYYDGSGKPWAAILETDKADNGADADMVILSDDGNKMFFIQGGTLYYREVESKKDAVKLAANVASYIIDSKGKNVVYLSEGSLYRHNLKDKTKLDSDVDSISWVSEDLKKVIYTKSEEIEVTEDEETNTKTVRDIYLCKGKKSEKLETSVDSFQVNEDGSKIYLVKEKTLYVKKGTKDKVKIAADVERVNAVYEKGIYYTTSEKVEKKEGDFSYETNVYTLCYYNGKKTTELAEDIGTMAYANKTPAVAYYTSTRTEDEENPYVYDYFIAVEGNAMELDSDVYDVTFTEDGKTAYYLEKLSEEELQKAAEAEKRAVSDLYSIKVSAKKLGNAEKLDEEVDYERGFSLNIKTGMYWYYKDYNNENSTATLYVKGKEVASDVVANSVAFSAKAKTFTFYTDMEEGVKGATLWFSKNGKKPVKVADGVVNRVFDAEGNIYYLKDQSETNLKSDLYVNKLTKKSKLVDQDVLSVTRSYTIGELMDMYF